MSLKRMRWSKCQRVWVLQPQPNLNKRRICESENDYSTRRGVYDIFYFLFDLRDVFQKKKRKRKVYSSNRLNEYFHLFLCRDDHYMH